jgi:hypothetical protein
MSTAQQPRVIEAKANGLTTLNLSSEERAEFKQFHAQYLAELQPKGVLEFAFFDQIVHAAWNLRRGRRMEAQLEVDAFDPLADDKHFKMLERLGRYLDRNERMLERAVKQLQALQTSRAVREQMTPEAEKKTPALADLAKSSPLTQRIDPMKNLFQAWDFEAKVLSRTASRTATSS